MTKHVLVLGGCGFIGLEVVEQLIQKGYKVTVLDKLTYAAQPALLNKAAKLVEGDVADFGILKNLLLDSPTHYILNLAAETNVDKSIESSLLFTRTNIIGTQNVLEAIRNHSPQTRLVQVSTDEVFSEKSLPFNEESSYAPRNPYSASKAAADHLVMAWVNTFGINASITHCSNNVGLHQDTSKLVPRLIKQALANEPLTLYGDGLQERDWLYVRDHADGIIRVMEQGKTGERYCFGSGSTKTNKEVAQAVIRITNSASEIQFIKDRPGHDQVYKVDATKAKEQLGWTPSKNLEEVLKEIIGVAK